jgi:hypothetical protein
MMEIRFGISGNFPEIDEIRGAATLLKCVDPDGQDVFDIDEIDIMNVPVTPEIRDLLLKDLIEQYNDALEVGFKLTWEDPKDDLLPF